MGTFRVSVPQPASQLAQSVSQPASQPASPARPTLTLSEVDARTVETSFALGMTPCSFSSLSRFAGIFSFSLGLFLFLRVTPQAKFFVSDKNPRNVFFLRRPYNGTFPVSLRIPGAGLGGHGSLRDSRKYNVVLENTFVDLSLRKQYAHYDKFYLHDR